MVSHLFTQSTILHPPGACGYSRGTEDKNKTKIKPPVTSDADSAGRKVRQERERQWQARWGVRGWVALPQGKGY